MVFLAFIAVAGIVGPIIFMHSRRLFREQKNYERGLKTCLRESQSNSCGG